ncbi:MAG: phosphoribosylformylglycinamidine cyclo-ligase [bacterium]|nr:phosphoribosylformylglycinamidine cyclo-ligase [bacterium]
MTDTKSSYAKAGVDIDKGNQAVTKIKKMVRKMGVKEIGKFSGFFPLKENMAKPVLVSSADGVGTKLKIAFLTGKHNTIGKDLVNHCVDDILVYGAKPLFFLDYVATGKLEPDTVSSIVSGMLDGCVENDFVLLGGETAEMPGFYNHHEYDVAGFIVGIVDNDKIVGGKNVKKGDLLIGLPSTGLHTNGYSLARHIIFEQLKLTVDTKIKGMENTLGDELLKVHKSYLKPVSKLIENNLVKGISHITGGGFMENIPRTLPDDVSVQIERIWPVPEIFTFLCEEGNVPMEERYRVFNMGIGMVLILDKNHLSQAEKILKDMDEKYYLIGQVVEKKNGRRVIIK